MDEKRIAQFWKRVDRNGSVPAHVADLGNCWEWRGQVANGYGRLSLYPDGRIYAHRASWELHRGDIAGGLCVLHRCDNRLCVRPEHLFLGTRPENSADMVAKGRSTKGCRGPFRGTAHPRAKLNDSTVRAIREARREGRILTSIAAEYGVSKKTILNIVHGRIWRHVV